MNRMSLLSFVAIVTLLTGACASSGQPSGQVDSSRDLSEMKERILELQEQAAVTEVEMDRLRAQVTKLEERLTGGMPTGAMEPGAVITEPPRSFQTPPPVSSNTEPSIEETDLEPGPVLGSATGTVEDSGVTPTDETLASSSASDQPSTTLQPVDPAAQALYDRGYTLYHQGKYLDAEASFQRFLQAYPSTELSDNAQFWIGESRYSRGDTRGALAAFREVLQKYPDGNKVPDALIKEGDCLEKLGDRDGARDRYEEVKRRFPDSGAAVMAEDRLASLDG